MNIASLHTHLKLSTVSGLTVFSLKSIKSFVSTERVVKDIDIDAGGLGFDSQAGQIGHRSITACHAAMFLRSCADKALSRGNGPRIRNTL